MKIALYIIISIAAIYVFCLLALFGNVLGINELFNGIGAGILTAQITYKLFLKQ